MFGRDVETTLPVNEILKNESGWSITAWLGLKGSSKSSPSGIGTFRCAFENLFFLKV